MEIVATLRFDGREIDQYVFSVAAQGDLATGAAAAFAVFRKKHPDLSLFDCVISFAKA